AAEVFYDNEKFSRKGAAPNRVVQTLFGKHAVQTLDGKEHHHRKALFMSMMSEDSVGNLIELTKLHWEISLDKWSQIDQIILYDEVKELLCKVAFKWIGYPIHEQDVQKMTKELAAMFETPAAIGPTHWLGRNARNQLEKNIQEVIQRIRKKEVQVNPDTILYQFAFHQDLEGNLLDLETAAVEV
ncbi:cytochrome P450, partial [Butyricicoccus sp. 1XD8-22]